MKVNVYFITDEEFGALTDEGQSHFDWEKATRMSPAEIRYEPDIESSRVHTGKTYRDGIIAVSGWHASDCGEDMRDWFVLSPW